MNIAKATQTIAQILDNGRTSVNVLLNATVINMLEQAYDAGYNEGYNTGHWEGYQEADDNNTDWGNDIDGEEEYS